MKHPETVLLYVNDTAVSAEFYHRLFGAPIVEQSVNFAMLVLPGGANLGLWARHDVTPKPAAGAAGFELCVTLGSVAEVDKAFAEASTLAPVAQERTRLDFGYTFVVASPDGHLVRAFSPGA